MRHLRRSRSRRGATAVEFAFVAIPFFLLVYGAVCFGSLIMVQNVLSAAAADGARAASVAGNSTDDVINAVESRLARGGLSAADASITVTPTDPTSVARGVPVTVQVSMASHEASWLDSSLFPLSFDVSSEVTQIKE